MAGNAKMSLRSPEEWHAHSAANVKSATIAHGKAVRTCDTSRQTHGDCLQENLAAYNHAHDSLKSKVSDSQQLVTLLENRARSVEKAIDTTKVSLAKLEAARRAKEAPLQLCTWRMDQRDKRPLREQVRDSPETALEDERGQVLECQRKIVDAEKRTRKMILTLEDVLKELNHDISDKRHALNIDDMCLRTTHRSWQTAIERGLPSAVSPGTSQLDAQAGNTQRTSGEQSTRNEKRRQTDAGRHNQLAMHEEQHASDLLGDNSKLIEDCGRTVSQCQSRTESRLQERVNENQQMRRRLEEELQTTLGKIEHTKDTMAETKAQIKALEEPMGLVSTRDTWRKQRALREQIHDPVSTRLEDQKLSLIRANEALRSQYQQEKNTLADLVRSRDRLREDLGDKTAALHIDLNCLSHEAINMASAGASISRHKLKSAMKADKTFSATGKITVRVPYTAR